MSEYALPPGVRVGGFYCFNGIIEAKAVPVSNMGKKPRNLQFDDGKVTGVRESDGFVVMRAIPLGKRDEHELAVPPSTFGDATEMDSPEASKRGVEYG